MATIASPLNTPMSAESTALRQVGMWAPQYNCIIALMVPIEARHGGRLAKHGLLNPARPVHRRVQHAGEGQGVERDRSRRWACGCRSAPVRNVSFLQLGAQVTGRQVGAGLRVPGWLGSIRCRCALHRLAGLPHNAVLLPGS